MITTKQTDFLKTTLRRIIERFTIHHNLLAIETVSVGGVVNVFIQAHRADTSRLIGERGASFRALSTLVAALAGADGYRAVLQPIAEPTAGEPEKFTRFVHNPGWDRECITRLLELLCNRIFEGRAAIEARDACNQTIYVVRVPVDEMPECVRAIGSALHVIFNAIGKSNGRLIMVGVEMTGAPEEAGR